MKKTIIISSIITIGLAFWLGLYIHKWEYRKPLLEVHFFSLNRGRSVFIRTPENKTILVGAGQNSEVIREITKVMPFYSRKIDYIFIPSAVPAQIGGLLDVIDRYEVSEIIKPKYISTSTVLSKLNTQISHKKIHVREVERGDRFSLGGLDVIVVFPNSDFKYNKTSLPELGLIFEYNKTQLFLIGNLSKTIQKYISKSLNASVSQNLLEFYNSNGKAKNSEDLLEKIKPKFIFSTKEKSTSWVSDGFSWKLFDSI